jgi:hypothetical protein
MQIEITVTDLQHDGEGWCANGCWGHRYTIEVKDDASNYAIARAVLRECGYTGARRDEWSGAEFSWRDGAVGIYAEAI